MLRLRLQSCVFTQFLSSPTASPIPSLHRLLSTAAPAPPISAGPAFAVEDYLVDTCGLTRPQALKASTKLSHLKSPSKPDAVLAYLAGLGLSSADVAAVIAKDPKFLCISVERTLDPIFVGLSGLGLSRSEIACLVSFARIHVRCRSIVSKVQYYLHLFGSLEKFLLAVKRNSYLLGSDLETTVKPNVAFLRECGLGASDVAQLCLRVPRILGIKLEQIRTMVACADGLGVPRDSAMFKVALNAVAFLSEEKITDKMVHLKNTLGWSDAEVGSAVCKAPMLLTRAKDKIQRVSEFLLSEVGLEPAYIADRPVMLSYSLEGRLRPRYYVMKFLKENGVLHRDRDYNTALKYTEKVFMMKYISRHSEVAQYLADKYAAACRGEMPTNFRLA
jgi:mTERF domain-containing protein